MKSLKEKILWAIIIALSVLQLALAVVMIHDSHQSLCSFDEHCILQSITDRTEAVQPLLILVLPIFFVFISLRSLNIKAVTVTASPPNFNFLQRLDGIVKRE